MREWMRRMLLSVLLATMLISTVFAPEALAATVTKTEKTYEIAVVFDNSGSMYLNPAWCRAKYAMQIFASMLNYDNGDVLKIFPMWAVTTDGSTPQTGGSYAGIEIRNRDDIQKIWNLYTVEALGTPFAPVTEAYQALQQSSAKEKWLIVLTDGAFNEEARNENATIELQSRLSALASQDIKVQYLGFGSAQTLTADPSKNFFTKKSDDKSLKTDLINICNSIFQRSVLPAKFNKGGTLSLDLSMKNVIVFAQGAGARITGLSDANGKAMNVALDSGAVTYSTVTAGGRYANAEKDTSLAGQVVTFSDCPKGTYTLQTTGADAIEIFYEPNVDISMSMTDSDGQTVDYQSGQIPAGDYTVSYGIVDAVTGDDVTKSELMGNDVSLTSYVQTSDGTKVDFTNGGTLTLKPDSATKLVINGRYLKDYTISTEDDPTMFPPLSISLPEMQSLSAKLSTEQANAWYQTQKQDEWKPIRLDVALDGQPLSDEQISAMTPSITFSPAREYTCTPIPGESAYEIKFWDGGKIETGNYTVAAEVSQTDEFGQVNTAKDKLGFDVQNYSKIWEWLFWLLLLVALALLIVFILTRKAWPKMMYFTTDRKSGLVRTGKNMNIVGGAFPSILNCTAEKLTNVYQRGGRRAGVRIVKVSPHISVKSFKIGTYPEYTRQGSEFLDSGGKPFSPINLKNNTTIKVEFRNDNKLPIDGRVFVNRKR